MYGVIHQAARELAAARLGQEECDALLARSGLTGRHFIGAEHHSDEDTMRLVRLIAERLGTSLDAMLNEFGRSWLGFADGSAYGRALRLAGSDLESFVGNLDRMHAWIGSAMPQARLPTFAMVACEPRVIRLLYRSERTGLEPFLQGILAAAARRFGERARVRYAPGPDGVLFTISRYGRRG